MEGKTKSRRCVTVTIDRELYGVFESFTAAYEQLRRENFKLKTYSGEIKKFKSYQSLKLLAAQRGNFFYTVEISRFSQNKPLISLRPLSLN